MNPLLSNPFGGMENNNPNQPKQMNPIQNLQAQYQQFLQLGNPMTTLEKAAVNNPKLQEIVMQLKNGVNPETIARNLMAQNGINPNEFIKLFR